MPDRANPSNALGVAGKPLLVFLFGVQQMSHVTKLLRGVLERFNLLSELGLFGLLFAQNLMDILHERPPFGTVCSGLIIVNKARPGSDYARNLAKAVTRPPPEPNLALRH